MTEKEIIMLRFEKELMSEPDEQDDYYFAYDIADGLTLISNAKSDCKGGQWYVEIFNTDPIIRFHEYAEVQALMNQLESRIVKPANK